MSRREELEENNKALKGALEKQLDNLKGDFQKVGKSALWIGGGLLATYLVVDALTGGKKKKKNKPKPEKEPKEKRKTEDNLLMSTVKEQAIVFLLGLAAQQLATFLSDLDTENEEDNT